MACLWHGVCKLVQGDEPAPCEETVTHTVLAPSPYWWDIFQYYARVVPHWGCYTVRIRRRSLSDGALLRRK